MNVDLQVGKLSFRFSSAAAAAKVMDLLGDAQCFTVEGELGVLATPDLRMTPNCVEIVTPDEQQERERCEAYQFFMTNIVPRVEKLDPAFKMDHNVEGLMYNGVDVTPFTSKADYISLDDDRGIHYTMYTWDKDRAAAMFIDAVKKGLANAND